MSQHTTWEGHAQNRSIRKGVSKGLGIENQQDFAIKLRVKSSNVYNFLTEIFWLKFFSQIRPGLMVRKMTNRG
jgi:hypothetical protein